MSTLLLAEGLISEEEAVASKAASDRYEAATGDVAERVADDGGDFFERAQSFIDLSIEKGLLSAAEAGQFRAMFERIRKGLEPGPGEGLPS
jgi:hypothetical protein